MKPFASIAAVLIGTSAIAQLNMTLLGNLDYQALHNSDLSNLWGYTDEQGNEYAIVGVNGDGGLNPGGVSVVNVTDPANPVEVFFTPGPQSTWREVKTWGDYAYITTEAEHGLTIIDLSPLPASTVLPTVLYVDPTWDTSHSLFIDENGRLYIHGANRGNGGVIMYDLTIDPMDPVEVGDFDPWYCHDSFARGDTLYAAHIYDGFFSIVDVSDPANPVILGTQSTPSTFTHNTWLDDSGDHLFTTDEVDGAFVGSYDVSDPTDIQWIDQLQSVPGTNTIPHNTYWLNDFLVTSYYTYGVAVYDVTHPDNMIETGNYDTSPFSGGGFAGAWGVYCFLPSGNLLVSDIETGLWIIAPDYVHACWLEGTVTDAVTTSPISGATVTLLGPDMVDQTAVDGQYATGYHAAGTYDVSFVAPGYISQTVTGVVLDNGVVTVLDVQLQPLTSFAWSGQVVDALSGNGVPGAQVQLTSGTYTWNTACDVNGNFSLPAIFEDTYDILAGQWGWRTNCSTSALIQDGTPPLVIELDPGYYDDFILDFNWTVQSAASTGHWERAEPVGTTNGPDESNPDVDAADDCGDQAYITGNGGGGAGNDDVDDGATTLTSPSFDLSTMIDPYLHYRWWFYNASGFDDPNDTLRLLIDNGVQEVEIDAFIEATAAMSQWNTDSARVLDLVSLSSDMHFIVSIADADGGNLVEGGLDVFEVIEHGGIGVDERPLRDALQIRPNPNDGSFTLQWDDAGERTIEVFDATGRVVMPGTVVMGPAWNASIRLPAGVYSVRMTGTDRGSRILPLVVE